MSPTSRVRLGYLLALPAVVYYGWYIVWKLIQWVSPTIYLAGVAHLPDLLQPYGYSVGLAAVSATVVALAGLGYLLARAPDVRALPADLPREAWWVGITVFGWSLVTFSLIAGAKLAKEFATLDQSLWESLGERSSSIVHTTGDQFAIALVDAIDGPGEEIVLGGLLVAVLVRHTRLQASGIIIIGALVRGALHMSNDALFQALGYAGVMGALSAAFILRYRRVAPLVIGHLAWNLTTSIGLAPEAITEGYRAVGVPVFGLIGALAVAWAMVRGPLRATPVTADVAPWADTDEHAAGDDLADEALAEESWDDEWTEEWEADEWEAEDPDGVGGLGERAGDLDDRGGAEGAVDEGGTRRYPPRRRHRA